MKRWRLTLDLPLDADTPEAARDVLYAVSEELRAAVEVSAADVDTHDAPLHAALDAIEDALRAGALDDGTPVLARVDAIEPVDAVERRLILRALTHAPSVAQHGLALPSAGAPSRVPPPLPGDFAWPSPDAAPSKGDR